MGRISRERVQTNPCPDSVAYHILPVLVMVSIAKKNTMTKKQVREGRTYFALQLSGHTSSSREVRTATQSRNLEAGTEA